MFLLLTAVMGAIFLVNKVYEYSTHLAVGETPAHDIFFDPLAIALPAELDSYRRVKRRLFAGANSALDKLMVCSVVAILGNIDPKLGMFKA